MKTLRNIALTGNAIYILWIFYNAIDESGQGIKPVQTVVLGGLIILLTLNIILLRKHS